MKVWLDRGTSQNTSAQARAPLQRLHVGTHSRPIIQQDRSSEAIVSAISQLHLLSVLLAILESSGLRGPASNRINPAGQLRLQYRNCTCCSSCWRSSIVAAARLNIHQNQSSKASVSALSHWHLLLVLMAFSLLIHQSSSAPSMATTALHCSMDSPVPVRHAAAMSSAYANTYRKQ